MSDLNKHYIRVDKDNCVIKSFSDAFEQPQDGDIFIKEGGRHYNNLDLYVNGLPKYKYVDGQMVERSLEEIVLPVQPPTTEERISALEDAFLAMLDI